MSRRAAPQRPLVAPVAARTQMKKSLLKESVLFVTGRREKMKRKKKPSEMVNLAISALCDISHIDMFICSDILRLIKIYYEQISDKI